MKRIESLIIICIILIVFNSCATNKVVYLKAKEPFIFMENGLQFSISEKQEYWVYFDPDNLPSSFTMFVDSDIMPEYLRINKLTMVINELDISVIKDNINIGVTLDKQKFNTPKHYWASEDFDDLIFTSDILNEYNKKYDTNFTSKQMFKEFEKVKEVLFRLDIEYKIQGVKYNSTLRFIYKTRNEISNRFWDNLMSV